MEEKTELQKSPVPFFMMLKRPQVTRHYTSYDGSEDAYQEKDPDDDVLLRLQTYAKASDEEAYNKLVSMHTDRMFRRTKGEVYEMMDEGKSISVRIAIQVKEHSLTWYFWAPGAMDQYPQEFRDTLYNSAALAHKQVTNGCDLYYRGSNSVHVKMMHHLESESGHNHNHYRLKNNQPYTPVDFSQHMLALKETEAFEQFFEEGEIENIIAKFTKFHAKWHHKSEEELSLREQYIKQDSQRLNTGDVIELMLFGHQQEPCRINPSELKVDYEKAREEIQEALRNSLTDEGEKDLQSKLKQIETQYQALLKYREKGGSRGLFSEIASTRQTYMSELAPIYHVAGQDGSFGAPPDIPEWAKTLLKQVEEGKQATIETRAEREVIAESTTEESIAKFNEEIPERVRKANLQKGARFFKESEVVEDKQTIVNDSTPSKSN